MLSSDEAFFMLKKAGIITNKQTFLRYVREGKIKGHIRYKRDGYRFKEEDIKLFIEVNKEEDAESPFEELTRLRIENEELRFRLKIPDTVIQAENLKLAQKVKELETKLKKLVDDQTIRIRVE